MEENIYSNLIKTIAEARVAQKLTTVAYELRDIKALIIETECLGPTESLDTVEAINNFCNTLHSVAERQRDMYEPKNNSEDD